MYRFSLTFFFKSLMPSGYGFTELPAIFFSELGCHVGIHSKRIVFELYTHTHTHTNARARAYARAHTQGGTWCLSATNISTLHAALPFLC